MFVKSGMAALSDGKRSGRPSKLTAEKADQILTMTVRELPQESSFWSQRLLAKYANVPRRHVVKVWRAADLKPHRLRTFKLSRDKHFAEKVRDIVGLYMNPPENALVLSVDEKTQIQALDRTQPMLQLRPGQIERRTHDYKRHGTRSLYAALNVANGKVIGRVTARHRAVEFIDFLKQINAETPKELDLHVILDNSSTHKTAEVKSWLDKHPRFHMHFTPTSASWLNAVERWLGTLENRTLYRGVHTSVKELTNELYRHIDAHNKYQAKPFKWTKSADTIIAKVEKIKQLPELQNIAAKISAP